VHCLSYSSNFGSKPKSACACPNLSSRIQPILFKQDKHLYDMQYKNEVYVSDLWNILKKQGNKIIIAEDTYLIILDKIL
jgi:hypothetical protein